MTGISSWLNMHFKKTLAIKELTLSLPWLNPLTTHDVNPLTATGRLTISVAMTGYNLLTAIGSDRVNPLTAHGAAHGQ